jgi:hypothetical protein
MDWNERYLSGNTQWDLGTVSPPLKHYINQLTDKALHILIPGGGNSYEAGYLWERGFRHITVVDIATVVIGRLQQQYAHTGIRLLAADVFTHHERYDLILEQTFFCALEPRLRPDYVRHMHSLLHEGGRLAGVLFDRNFAEPGPPFGGDRQSYRELFAPYFRFHTFDTCYNSHPARQGYELFINLTKKNNGHAKTH